MGDGSSGRILASNLKVDGGRQCTVSGASRKGACKGDGMVGALGSTGSP